MTCGEVHGFWLGGRKIVHVKHRGTCFSLSLWYLWLPVLIVLLLSGKGVFEGRQEKRQTRRHDPDPNMGLSYPFSS